MKQSLREKYGVSLRDDLTIRKFLSEAIDSQLDQMDEGMFDSLKQVASGVKNDAQKATKGMVDKAKQTYHNTKDSVKQGIQKGVDTYKGWKLEKEKEQLKQKLDQVLQKNLEFFKRYKEVFGKEAPMIITNAFRKAMAE